MDNYLPTANKEYYSTWHDLLDVINLTIQALATKPQESLEEDIDGQLDAMESHEILIKLIDMTDE